MEKINIAELLKGCPKGMELDCTMFEDVKFISVEEGDKPICIRTDDIYRYLTKFGTWTFDDNAKCVIFPKGKTTWNGFQRPFEDGDILATDLGSVFFLNTRLNTYDYYGCHVGIGGDGYFHICEPFAYKECCGLATEEEKQKLFDAIKAKGYKWNEETKTLDKLSEPHTPEKFYIRIGEIPSEERSAVYNGDAVVGYENGVSVYDCIEADGLYHIVMPFPLKRGQGMTYECLIQEITQCRYEIEKPRNVYLVSGTEVGKGHDNEPLIKEVKILKDLTRQFNTKNYNTEKIKTLEKLVPNKFDINTLKPFDKVLVRNTNKSRWWGQFYMTYDENEEYPFECTYDCWKQCIPYEGNEHLLDTTNDCDDFYKTW